MKRGSRSRSKKLVVESPQVFKSDLIQKFVLGEIQKKQWIYKIISGERESERIIASDEDLIVLPDLDLTDVLNWMVIFKDPSLFCIRNLEGRHIPLLRKARKFVQSVMGETQFDKSMMYFHYPPSVWQLHLHVVASCDSLRTTNSMQKVFFLDDVISFLEIDPEFFHKATLSFVVPVHDANTTA